MGGDFTRRKLLVAPALAVAVPSQGQSPADSPAELLNQAKEAVRRNRELLGAQKLPIAAEPAFQFKA